MQSDQPPELGTADLLLTADQSCQCLAVLVESLRHLPDQEFIPLAVFQMDAFLQMMENLQLKDDGIDDIVLVATLFIQ